MTQLRSLMLAVALAFATTSVSLAEDAGVKIGTVDMQKALQSVEAGKKAMAQLEKDVTSKKKELQNEEAAIRKAVEEFKKQSLVMNEEARGKKQEELQQRAMKFEESKMRSQMELQQKEQEFTRPILTKLRTIISELAKQKGYAVVLDKNDNIVHFSQDKDDLTSDVIAAFNKQKS
jgi:outer membrane protein